MSFSLLMSFHFILPWTSNILLSRILLPILKVPSYITTFLPHFILHLPHSLFSQHAFKKILSSLSLFSHFSLSHLNPFLIPFIRLFSSILIIPFSLPSGGFDKEHGWPVGRVQGPPHGVRRGVRTGKYVSHLFLGIWPILIVFFPILTVILEDEFAGSSLIRVVLRWQKMSKLDTVK